jgi:hypothetical protein
MSYADSLRQQARWIREALDPDFDPLMKVTLEDIDIEELEEAAAEIDDLKKANAILHALLSNREAELADLKNTRSLASREF